MFSKSHCINRMQHCSSLLCVGKLLYSVKKGQVNVTCTKSDVFITKRPYLQHRFSQPFTTQASRNPRRFLLLTIRYKLFILEAKPNLTRGLIVII